MQDPNDLQQQILQQHDALQQQRGALQQLQQAKLEALQQVLGNYGDFRYVDLDDFLDPDNQNWNDYSYKISSPLVGLKGRVGAGTPIGMLIQQIRDAKNIDDVNKQLEVWNSYKPLDSSDNGTSYIRYFIPGFGAYRNTPSIGSRPIQTIAGGTGSAQGVVTGGSTQGAQAGNTGGGTPSTQGVQGVQTGNSGGTAGGTSGIASTKGIQTGGTSGTYASTGVPRGGTKTIGYDPNPGNVSLAYAMRSAPEQERRTALIDKWNREHGRSGGNTYASAGIPRGSVVSPATMMRTSGVQPIQAAYGNNAPMGEGFDYTRTYDPMSNSMRPNDSYSYYDPSRNAPSGGDGTDLTLTYDPMTGQLVRR